ncbi:recombinase family protein [Actinoplanes lobatus]|uniref:recombinase family protein n=1 Tax=Actinoplanes lobatus TaxID=113568 RepID=UPI001EF2F432|nr:recombinase family protein [Actinoplanes lobatus]
MGLRVLLRKVSTGRKGRVVARVPVTKTRSPAVRAEPALRHEHRQGEQNRVETAGDTLVVPSLDRLSRSLADLITTVGELRRCDVGSTGPGSGRRDRSRPHPCGGAAGWGPSIRVPTGARV